MIFLIGVLALGMAVIPQSVSARKVGFSVLKGEISFAEKLLVCCEMADQKVLDLDSAMALLRNGSMTITKLDTGVYRVVYPGGGIDILILIDA